MLYSSSRETVKEQLGTMSFSKDYHAVDLVFILLLFYRMI